MHDLLPVSLFVLFLAGQPFTGFGLAVTLNPLGELQRALDLLILQRLECFVKLPDKSISAVLLQPATLDEIVDEGDPFTTLGEAQTRLEGCALNCCAAFLHDALEPIFGHVRQIAQQSLDLGSNLLTHGLVSLMIMIFSGSNIRSLTDLIQSDRGHRVFAIHCSAGRSCHERCCHLINCIRVFRLPEKPTS
ncbi:hypothetical protein [Luteimonas qiangzhengi]|uniref:hypothetical protein n=1 Tax=Luteimonas sp. MJ146 TaxID=3129240 RepID=UPI0031BB65B4